MKINRVFAAGGLLVIGLSFVSCIRPYDKPTFAEVESNETAFLIPLFTDAGTTTEDQVKIDSEKYYQEHMVQDKLFEIPHKWIKTGRTARSGHYVDTVKVIKVSRTPISGTWEPNTSTSIKLETKESSGFQIPMAYNIKIKAEDCAKYLYNYSPSKQLKEVIDTNINKWIVGKMNERFHALSYMEVSENKDAIIREVSEEAKVYFAERGITIESLTAYDGIYWDDQAIEDSISKLVNAQATQKAKDEELKVALKEAEINMAKAEKEAEINKVKAQAEAEIAVIEAKKDRDIANMKAATMNVLARQQEIENSKTLAEAQAKAIIIAAEKGASVPGANATTFVINSDSLESLGLGDLMKR